MSVVDQEKNALSSPNSPPSNIYKEYEAFEATAIINEAKSEAKSWAGLLCVVGSFMGCFSTFGLMNAYGAFQERYEGHELSYRSSSAISWIGSSQQFVFFLSGWVVGRMFDVYGPRILILSGSLLTLLALMMASISKTYTGLLVTQGFVFGLGSAFVVYPCFTSLSTHYSKYKSTAIGVALVGCSVGGVIFPIIIRELFASVGFRTSFQVLASICFFTGFVAVLSVSSKRDHGKSTNGRPWLYLDGLFDTNFVLTTVGNMIIAFSVFIPYIYIVSQTNTLNLKTTTSFVLSVMNGTSALGAVIPSIMSDVYGRFNLFIASGFWAGLSCFVLWLPTTMAPLTGEASSEATMIVIFAITYGILSGAIFALMNPCVFQISGEDEEGTRFGVFNTMIALPTLLGGPIGGALLAIGDDGNGFKYVAAFTGSTLILGSLVIMLARMRLSGGLFLMKV